MQLLYPYIVKFTLHIRCTPTKWQEAQLAIVLVHNRLRTADCPCSVSCIRRCTCVPFLFTVNLQLLHSLFPLMQPTPFVTMMIWVISKCNFQLVSPWWVVQKCMHAYRGQFAWCSFKWLGKCTAGIFNHNFSTSTLACHSQFCISMMTDWHKWPVKISS